MFEPKIRPSAVRPDVVGRARLVDRLAGTTARLVLPGQLDAAVAGWFGRFPAEMTTREDSYLLNPDFPGLSVKVRAGGETWWSLGFEATGPADLLRSTLQSTAALVFDQAPPGDVELGMSHCLSYAEWLSRRHVS